MKENKEKPGRGRPTKFRPEYVDLAREYFTKPTWNDEFGIWIFPTRVYFAKMLGVDLQSVKNWEAEHEEFGKAIAEGIDNSKELRISFAENEKINPMFTKFVLASAYGMTEKSAVDIGSGDGKPFEVNIRVIGEGGESNGR